MIKSCKLPLPQLCYKISYLDNRSKPILEKMRQITKSDNNGVTLKPNKEKTWLLPAYSCPWIECLKAVISLTFLPVTCWAFPLSPGFFKPWSHEYLEKKIENELATGAHVSFYPMPLKAPHRAGGKSKANTDPTLFSSIMSAAHVTA